MVFILITHCLNLKKDADATVATKLATGSEATTEVRQLERETAATNIKETESEAHFQSECSWLREFQQRDGCTLGSPGYCLVDDLKRARQVKLLKKSRAEATSTPEQLERNSWQQQLGRINSSKPHERAAAFQELQSFQQDALNCICYCTGLEIDLFSTSPTTTARYTVKAAVRAFTYMQNHCQTVAGTCTDCLKKIITELEVEATGTTAIAYAAGATTMAGTYTDYIKKIITELEDEVDYQECNQE